jgi:hypothetical protein
MEDDNDVHGLGWADAAPAPGPAASRPVESGQAEADGAELGQAEADRAEPDRAEAPPEFRLSVPRPETGELRVDAALSLLDDLTELPVAEHPAVFERVHAQLGEVLGELRGGPPAGRDGG